jgi:Rps23 Pro-64 3,4-dihydroxylase Tpa1-like proline 4-hydroxylase
MHPRLYNGGITKMMPGDFMCPHLDNSHNYDRTQRRAVVLLYYMSPQWREDYGGALELWTMISNRRQWRSLIKATGW